MVNAFVARLTPLAPLLTRSVSNYLKIWFRVTTLNILFSQAIPSSSPIHAGYVEWESKRGKWSKRWLQLREHSLWISKRDNVRCYTPLKKLLLTSANTIGQR